jgi:hypothetical protein
MGEISDTSLLNFILPYNRRNGEYHNIQLNFFFARLQYGITNTILPISLFFSDIIYQILIVSTLV